MLSLLKIVLDNTSTHLPPPLPGPSPAAVAAAAEVSKKDTPPPLPGPSPAARAAARAAEEGQASLNKALHNNGNACIVVTGEASGIKLGVITLERQNRANPEFCAQCGVRDTLGKVTQSNCMYCSACWALLEDMAALKLSAGLSSDTWEERCEDCGKRDKNGAVDEEDQNFYCSECWALEDNLEASTQMSRDDGGSAAAVSVCTECGGVSLGEVDESDGNFYCNDCWAAIGLGPASPAAQKHDDNEYEVANFAETKASQLLLRSSISQSWAGGASHGHSSNPPPLPGPSPAARWQRERDHSPAAANTLPFNPKVTSLLNEHYLAQPSHTHDSASTQALSSGTAAQEQSRLRPVREQLRERDEKEYRQRFERETLEEEERMRSEREGKKETERVDRGKAERAKEEAKIQERERERANVKDKQKENKERRKDWKEWEEKRKREEALQREEMRRREAEQRIREEEEWRREEQRKKEEQEEEERVDREKRETEKRREGERAKEREREKMLTRGRDADAGKVGCHGSSIVSTRQAQLVEMPLKMCTGGRDADAGKIGSHDSSTISTRQAQLVEMPQKMQVRIRKSQLANRSTLWKKYRAEY